MKENKVKLRTKVFRIMVTILFFIFLTIFLSNKYGYYEYKKHEQVVLTETQIRNFEQDVKDGKEIDIDSYLKEVNPNYQTKLSQAGLNVSNSVAKVVKDGVESFFKGLNKLIME